MVFLACEVSSKSAPPMAEQRLGCSETVSRLGDLSIKDINLVKHLGDGSVFLAELTRGVPAISEAEGYVVAVKVSHKGIERTEKEKAILEVLDHPFVPKLFGTIEDDGLLYLLMEYCNGGDLQMLRHHQSGKRFDLAAVRFYAAEILVALEYLHKISIVHRDLKPENVLVRSNGHIMITDFDLSLKRDEASVSTAQLVSAQPPSESTELPSCVIPCFKPPSISWLKKLCQRGRCPDMVAEPMDLRSSDYVGTLEYLAPEIVSRQGHGSSVDWWTFGIFIYDLLHGFTPFVGTDNENTLNNIVSKPLIFPNIRGVSSAAEDLISRLLVRDPTRRLGSRLGAAEVKQQRFFSGVKWEQLSSQTPPYVPPQFCSCDRRN